MTSEPPRLRAADALGYGIGCIAYALPYQAVASFFPFFATSILGIGALWMGGIMAASTISDAVSDPLMGYLSDNTESRRFGRRHQYLVIGGVAVALLTWAFWSISPAWPAPAKIAALLLLVLLLRSALTVYVAPYNALGAELSSDYDERSTIQGYRATFYLIGMIVALAGSYMLFFRSSPEYPQGQLDPAAYPAMGRAFAVAVIAAAALTFLATRRLIPRLPQRSEVMRGRGLGGILPDLRSAARNSDFVVLALMILIIEVGFQITVAIGVHINTYTYHLAGPIIGIHGLVILGSSVLSQPLWLWISRRWEKRTALFTGMGTALVGFLGAPAAHVALGLLPLDAPSTPYTLGLFFLLGGIGNGAFMSLPYSMVADTVDAEQLRTGKRDEGLYFGVYTFAYKLGTSVSHMTTGLVLWLVGFNPALPAQSPTTQHDLAMIPAYLLLAFGPIAALALTRYTITRDRHAAIRHELEEREG